jgi:hypothetical protein
MASKGVPVARCALASSKEHTSRGFGGCLSTADLPVTRFIDSTPYNCKWHDVPSHSTSRVFSRDAQYCLGPYDSAHLHYVGMPSLATLLTLVLHYRFRPGTIYHDCLPTESLKQQVKELSEFCKVEWVEKESKCTLCLGSYKKAYSRYFSSSALVCLEISQEELYGEGTTIDIGEYDIRLAVPMYTVPGTFLHLVHEPYSTTEFKLPRVEDLVNSCRFVCERVYNATMLEGECYACVTMRNLLEPRSCKPTVALQQSYRVKDGKLTFSV